MARTYRERLAAGLLATGWQHDVDNASGKYEAYFHPTYPGRVFVGPYGALRAGDCVSKSHSLGCPSMAQTGLYKRLLDAGDKASQG